MDVSENRNYHRIESIDQDRCSDIANPQRFHNPIQDQNHRQNQSLVHLNSCDPYGTNTQDHQFKSNSAFQKIKAFLHSGCVSIQGSINKHLSSPENSNRFNNLHNASINNSDPFQRFEFLQYIDHFNSSNGLPGNNTFLQSFYVNDQFYRPGGPIWLYCQGEIPSRPELIVKYDQDPTFDLSLVESTQGLIVLLEMRYYGNSTIFSSFTTENMRYLTVNQIIADYANLIKNINLENYSRKYKDFINLVEPKLQSSNNTGSDVKKKIKQKWFVFGASFSASLAQWARIKYPELIHAAYASSGPVEIVPSHYYSDIAVYSAIDCSDQLVYRIELLDYFFEVHGNKRNLNLFTTYRAIIKDLFGFSLLEDVDFLYLLTSIVERLVTISRPVQGCVPLDLTNFCSFFDPATKPLDFLLDKNNRTEIDQFFKRSLSYLKPYANAIKSLVTNKKTNQSLDPKTAALSKLGHELLPSGNRGWLWLKCNQLGTFQTSYKLLQDKDVILRNKTIYTGTNTTGSSNSNSKTQMFSKNVKSVRPKLLSLEKYYWQLCQEWFGFDSNYSRIYNLNSEFGGKYVPVDSKTVYVEGELDPNYWSSVVHHRNSVEMHSEDNSILLLVSNSRKRSEDGYYNLDSKDVHLQTLYKKEQDSSNKEDLLSPYYPNVISIPTGYHHSELLPPSLYNTSDLFLARQKIMKLFMKWSNE
ncbi:hypothetical protein BB560_001024 [Smittium megazygosporum]|uniref:Uncharacterized protein n=1 Tax=Smittium megazygosporum TaxID=133381 RepID=A0A2T9ZIT8_9FUNG|nr:hypothetical protein BB560_001024 [Smittium megazygosporum]